MIINMQSSEFYTGLAIMGIVSGIANAVGQYMFHELIKPKLQQPMNELEQQVNKKLDEITKR